MQGPDSSGPIVSDAYSENFLAPSAGTIPYPARLTDHRDARR